jgi:hypothetical protein
MAGWSEVAGGGGARLLSLSGLLRRAVGAAERDILPPCEVRRQARGLVYLYSFFLGRGVWDLIRLGERVVPRVHDVWVRVRCGPLDSEAGL